ncbi:GlsB/YeaQ/YmgE family stress response membrane protein [Brevundimonas variabilis]|uniref:Putative membrane protein YeaQ/YmgE (Transglycosylase-associated protein family) n=1 Tax=Brevundimonas variabilis TaxID=74312 RepID=A0A7W9CKJ0_9CAUL|nr:GlsB/YeaQ/YmgE family stress response membrane protein [Brevundimonas variabilis]MBB5747169.1 putative membrane protein YeaQ/YmgE (transglycosylase-associated protein family) [Brevundimonas variabilis]
MGLGIIGWIVIGIVAGWLAEKVMGRSHGIVTNLIVGVIGALLGGFIASNLLGLAVGGFNLMTLLVAFAGACLLLFVLSLVKRRA